jgi:hypothetical protein
VNSIFTPSAFSTARQYWFCAAPLGGVPKVTVRTFTVEPSPGVRATEVTREEG